MLVDERGVAGLGGDFLRNSFGSILWLVPHADSIVKLTARCEVCCKKACFSLRKRQKKQTELTGGFDMDMPPTCRATFNYSLTLRKRTPERMLCVLMHKLFSRLLCPQFAELLKFDFVPVMI
ncbi:hypothetical protein MLD38_009087 [Melastoma candidum]|uniref:Uncharacterized protein n=1 Tax=Melastoma candidum TaxID=119954 RepID=A0ACB9RVJ9_9MYRT|nr:hypothetical protein MLD38_009087 [Melastoma candidum]